MIFLRGALRSRHGARGLEVKAIRAGRVQLRTPYVIVHTGNLLRVPYQSLLRFTHVHPPLRAPQVLPNAAGDQPLFGAWTAGYTLCVEPHYARAASKPRLSSKEKKQHDKRATENEREWAREQRAC